MMDRVAKGSDPMYARQFVERLKAYQSVEVLDSYRRSFGFDEVRSSTGDRFIGVRMGQVFALAKQFMDMPLAEIEELLESPIHEVRVGAVSIMDFQARSRKTTEARRKELFDLYIRRHDRINTWDLVDRSAPYVVGGYLYDKSRRILYRLARSKNMAERRTAIVSTLYFIRKGDVDDAFKIAELLLKDDHDLIHKATGWALRFAGDKDRKQLLKFLDSHAATMPRVTLRYALEHFDKKQRDKYMRIKAEEKPMTKSRKSTPIDEHLSQLPADQRRVLESLREAVRSVMPDADEVISYGVPMFKRNGKGVISMSAHKDHLSLHLMSPPLAKAMHSELKQYLKGVTLHFTVENPLPVSLVKKIVKARLNEMK